MKTAIAIAAACAACSASPTSPPDAPRAADAPRAPDAAPPDASPDAGPDAAPPPDLACLGQAAPTAAADPLVTTGKVFAIADYQIQAEGGVTVALRRTSDDATLASATTAADGSFSISVASGGQAIDGYYYVDDGVHRPTYGTAGAPLTGAQDALLIVADDAELSRWYADAGDTWDATKATAIAAITDCAPKSAAGSVTASPAPAHLVYYDPGVPMWRPSLDASPNGFALLTGAAATETVTAHAGGADFPPHAIATHPGALSLAVLPPTL